MKIDQKLNLVIPFESENGTFYIHSMPISIEVFERYHFYLAKAYSKIWNSGLGIQSAPRVSCMILRQIAKEEDLTNDIELGLIGEIKRLSNVVFLDKNSGWQNMPIDQAIKSDYFTKRELSEVENTLVFFTVNYHMSSYKHLNLILDMTCNLFGFQKSSSEISEFIISLQTSTNVQTSAIQQSSVPS